MRRTAERTQLLWDVTITAIEGGINYWAQITERNMSPGDDPLEVKPDFSVAVIPDDEEDEKTVGVEDIASAMNRISNGSIKVAEYVRVAVREAMVEMDASEIDADIADTIFQIAAFGEIIYG